MTKEDEHEVTKAGITTTADGSRHIPSSVRADGSVRKEIKIRPGYRPPEDIEKYKNRTAEAFRNNTKGKNGVPGAEISESGPPQTQSAAANKNAKRREARKKAAAEKKGEEAKSGDVAANGISTSDQAHDQVDPDIAKQKEVKKLVKKLRQAKELKDKKESGAALLPEQIEKVIKINGLVRQLDTLGFDAEGAEKAGEAEHEIENTQTTSTVGSGTT